MKVVVVGGGITGCFAAYFLLKRGHDVVLADYQPVKGVSTSIYNAGSIAAPPSFTSIGLSRVVSAYFKRRSPVYVSLRQILRHPLWYSKALSAGANPYNNLMTEMSGASLALYDSFFEGEKVEVDYFKGGLKLFANREAAEKHASALGGRFVDDAEAREMGFKGFGGGVLYDSRRVDPHRLVAFMKQRIREMGARIVEGKEVRLSRGGATGRVTAEDSSLIADIYVLSAGAWSNQLCAPLGFSPQVMPSRGLVLLYDTGGKQAFDYPATLEDEGVVLVPHGVSTLRLTGYFELVGYDPTYTKEREEWLYQATKAHMVRDIPLRLTERGVGFRPCTPDQLPVVGQVPRCDNAYLATGGARKGLTLAPLVGSMITAMVSGDQVDAHFAGRLSPSRFA